MVILVLSDCDNLHKNWVWAACTLIWNGSLRVHEALSRLQWEHDPQTTLMNEDIQILSEEIEGIERFFIRILIKSPKEDRIGKDMSLKTFGNDTFLCPVRAIKKYMREKCRLNLKTHNMPFFTRKDNSGYTGNDFNKHLTTLTADITLNTNSVVRSHSLRAGVPSELAKRGADPIQIQGVGRWQSEAWKDYCKLGRKERLNVTEQLCSATN